MSSRTQNARGSLTTVNESLLHYDNIENTGIKAFERSDYVNKIFYIDSPMASEAMLYSHSLGSINFDA